MSLMAEVTSLGLCKRAITPPSYIKNAIKQHHGHSHFDAKGKKTQMENKIMVGGSAALGNEDLLQHILSRLPALSFASAACVNKSWNKVCNQILSKPKLASALSLSPSLHVAVSEVLDKVLSEPIRPHFAIASVGMQSKLAATHQLITARLGSRTPVITNAVTGIIGLDAHLDEICEVKWTLLEDNLLHDFDHCYGIVLIVGYVPGLKVETIPLLRSKEEPEFSMVDKFLMDIRHYSASISGCSSPNGIILFGDQNIDIKPILAEMDYGLPEETVIVGDATSCFLFKTGENSQNYNGALYFFDAVALVFSRDSDNSNVPEIQFDITMSTGVLPFGPELKAVSVKEHNTDCSLLTARMEGFDGLLHGEEILEDIKEHIDDKYPYLYIGVIHQRGSLQFGSRSYMSLYEVLGAEDRFFIVNGVGIKPGDSFIFYHSDSDTASSSSIDVLDGLRLLNASSCCGTIGRNVTNANKEVFGGLIFSCFSRSVPLSEDDDDDEDDKDDNDVYFESYPFCRNFPETPLAGIFCYGEIGRGRGLTRLINQEEEDCSISGRCLLHHYSTVYLVMSYTIPPLLH